MILDSTFLDILTGATRHNNGYEIRAKFSARSKGYLLLQKR